MGHSYHVIASKNPVKNSRAPKHYRTASCRGNSKVTCERRLLGKPTIASCLLVVLIVCLCIPVNAQVSHRQSVSEGNSARANRLNQEGLADLSQGKYENARDKFREALPLAKGELRRNIEANEKKADASYYQGKFKREDSVKESLKQALRKSNLAPFASIFSVEVDASNSTIRFEKPAGSTMELNALKEDLFHLAEFVFSNQSFGSLFKVGLIWRQGEYGSPNACQCKASVCRADVEDFHQGKITRASLNDRIIVVRDGALDSVLVHYDTSGCPSAAPVGTNLDHVDSMKLVMEQSPYLNSGTQAVRNIDFGPYSADLRRRLKRAWFPLLQVLIPPGVSRPKLLP